MDIIRFMGPINQNTGLKLLMALDQARKKPGSEALLLLSTNGGETSAGLAIYRNIKLMTGLKLTAVNTGKVDSIGVVAFCGAQRRMACPGTTFLIHPSTFTFERETLGIPQLREKLNTLIREGKSVARIVADACGVKPSRIDRLIQRHSILGTDEAKKLGLIHEVCMVNIPENVPLQYVG